MRHLISGMVAAVAVMAASPAMACGYSSCSPCATGYVSPCAQTYVAPVATYGYGGCNTGCGWATERLADPVQQYYYVNQGPTYSGPGNWAPAPTYQEDGVYRQRPYYYGHRAYRPWRPRVSYYHHPRMNYRYGYAPRQAYAPRFAPAPYHYGRPLRRYY
jgi:hypothetical protein